MNPKIARVRWFVLVIIVFGLILVGLSLADMRQKTKRIDTVSLSAGPVWYATGIEFDTSRLRKALYRHAISLDNADEVRKRFDILWARLDRTMVGSTRDILLAYNADLTTYERLKAVLVANDSRVASLGTVADDKDVALEIFDAFNQFSEDLRASSISVRQTTALESHALLVDLFTIAKSIFYVSLIVSISVILLISLFISDNVMMRRVLTEKEALLEDAYAADVAKSQFVSMMNHELRTPLTSVSASLALLKSGAVSQAPEKASRLIEIAVRNCASLVKIVNDILDADKFASGNMKLDCEVIDLSKALNCSIDNHQSYAASHGVKICADGIEPNVKITADPARIDQAMANLLSNAVKFSNEGGKVQISLAIANERTVVAVKDHGRGIPEKDQSRIFERFQQVDSSDKRERGGTGLGLSIVKAITDAHDAVLTVESEPGKGSTFYISFPLTVGSVNGGGHMVSSTIAPSEQLLSL